MPHYALIGGVIRQGRHERQRLPSVDHLGGAGNDLDRDLAAGAAAPASSRKCNHDARQRQESRPEEKLCGISCGSGIRLRSCHITFSDDFSGTPALG